METLRGPSNTTAFIVPDMIAVGEMRKRRIAR